MNRHTRVSGENNIAPGLNQVAGQLLAGITPAVGVISQRKLEHPPLATSNIHSHLQQSRVSVTYNLRSDLPHLVQNSV